MLVSAFERLSQPELFQREQEEAAARRGGKGSAGAGKPLKISRSNDNCFRTAVRCPRCREAWGKPLSGLPNYAYNFLMQVRLLSLSLSPLLPCVSRGTEPRPGLLFRRATSSTAAIRASSPSAASPPSTPARTAKRNSPTTRTTTTGRSSARAPTTSVLVHSFAPPPQGHADD